MTISRGLFLTLVFCVGLGSSSFAQEKKTWRLGLMVCLTGACAEWGVETVKAVNLAVDEINSAGGVLGRTIETVVQDTAEGTSSGVGAVTAFRKLSEDPAIQYFIGPSWTPGGLSVAPLAAKRADVIVTSPSIGVAEFNEAGDNIFSLWPHDANASKALAHFALKKGWKKVAVLSSQQPWELAQGNAFSDEFKRIGGELLIKEEPLPTNTDFRSEVTKIKGLKPDAVFLSCFTQMGVASKQLRALGYQGPFFAIHTDDSRIETAAGALEGTIYSGHAPSDPSFVERFKARYKQEPATGGADGSYDIVKLYAWAVAKTGEFTPAKVKVTMQGAELPGASGIIKFDGKGGVTRTPVLYQIKGKEKIRYQE